MIPGSVNSLLMPSAAAAGGYQIERSLRFNSSDSAYLSKSIANITTFTLSYWMKRCGSGRNDTFVTENSTGFFYFVHTDGSIRVNDNTANRFTSNGLYRDPSAWYHVVINNNGTTFNLYVNGVLDKSVSVNLALYSGTALIGRDRVSSPSSHADFYLADIHFIDGQALTPSSFTEVSATTGQLIPKAYTGTYTGNSFWLKFNDNSAATATTLGKDSFLLGNNWTPNNLSVTAGAGNDSLVDTPTSYGTDTGAGGEVRGNYATLNPLAKGANVTLSDGNLQTAITGESGPHAIATVGMDYGGNDFYCEFTQTVAGSNLSMVGLVKAGVSLTTNYVGADANSWGYYGNGNKYTNGSASSYGSSWGANDVIGIAYKGSTGELFFYKNGVAQNSGNAAFSSLTNGPYFFAVGNGLGGTGVINFGQRPFAYTAPSGFKALCDTNLISTTITTSGSYTGNGTADGPFVYLNGVPTAMTIGGNAVTFGTHADKLANGFKIRTSSTTYNQNASSYNYSITSTGAAFKNARAQPNP